MENAKIIAERIKELRAENSLTQSKLGEMLNVSQDTISLWEKAKSLPNTEYIIKIANLFSVSADYLLGITDI